MIYYIALCLGRPLALFKPCHNMSYFRTKGMRGKEPTQTQRKLRPALKTKPKEL
jgi:hypothetical protein